MVPYYSIRRSLPGVLLIGLSLAAAGAGEDEAKSAASSLPHAQVDEIRARIETLQTSQAEYHKKLAAGEIIPDADLREQWPKIQEQVVALRSSIVSLNSLSADSPGHTAAQDKVFSSLQEIGTYLEMAGHPPFEPRVLDAGDLAEMERIENAIASLKYGDRKTATPVKLLSPAPCFTLIHLPVPIVLQCRPGDTVYLAAITGGAFHNGLSLVELKADAQGIAKTTWVSIGDAVADCDITIYSQAAIETQGIRIKVVSPSLPVLEGLPQPEHLKGEIPRLKSKITTANSPIPNP